MSASNIHPVKRFADPSKISTLAALRYVISGFYSDTEEFDTELDSFFKDNYRSKAEKLIELDKEAKKDHPRIAHVELYQLYHKEIFKNLDKIINQLNNHRVCFVNVFSVATKSISEKSGEYINIELTRSAGPKQGYSIFSAMNYLGECIENIESQQHMENQRVIYVPLGPIMTFASFSNKENKLVNGLEILLGKDNKIISNVNSELKKKNKEMIKGFKTFRDQLSEGLYIVHPQIYNSGLAKNMFSNIDNEYKENQVSHMCEYNRALTAFLWTNLIEKMSQQELWYYGEETSPIKTILNKVASATGKQIRTNKTMENTYCPVGGSTEKSAISKLGGPKYVEGYNGSDRTLLTSDLVLNIDSKFWTEN